VLTIKDNNRYTIKVPAVLRAIDLYYTMNLKIMNTISAYNIMKVGVIIY